MQNDPFNWPNYFAEAQTSHLQLFLTNAEAFAEAETHHYRALDADRLNLLLAINTAVAENACESIQQFTWAVGRPYGGYLSTYGYWKELNSLTQAAVSASEQLHEPLIAAGFLADLGTILLWQG